MRGARHGIMVRIGDGTQAIMSGQRREHGRPKGATRATAEGQLSAKGRHMLAVLLATERAMLEGTAAQRRTVRNRGVPWVAAAMGEVLNSSAASTILTNLEGRGLVCCFAQGGIWRGRRISHVKLSAQARAVAEFWEKYGQSKEQRRRWIAEVYKEGQEWGPYGPQLERGQGDPGEQLRAIFGAIYHRIEHEDLERVSRYSAGNSYVSAALNAVPDDKKHT